MPIVLKRVTVICQDGSVHIHPDILTIHTTTEPGIKPAVYMTDQFAGRIWYWSPKEVICREASSRC